MSASSACSSPFRARTTSCRSSSSRWAFCGGGVTVAGRGGMVSSGRRRSSSRQSTRSHPQVEDQDSKDPSKLQGSCNFSDLAGPLPAPQSFQALPSLVVEPVAEPVWRPFRTRNSLQIGHKQARAELPYLLAGSAPDGEVRGDETDPLAVAVLRGEALEQSIGVRRVPD